MLGEPAPALPGPAWLLPLPPRPLPNGYLRPVPAGASIGLLVAEVFADRVVVAAAACAMVREPRPSRLSL